MITLLQKKTWFYHACRMFLDASKSFDRVNRRKRLFKLESRGVPTYIFRLLSNELNGQYTCVRWRSTHAEFSPIGNGVKQGGILSLLLVNVYIDTLVLVVVVR